MPLSQRVSSPLLATIWKAVEKLGYDLNEEDITIKNCVLNQIELAIEFIRSLDPYPARNFSTENLNRLCKKSCYKMPLCKNCQTTLKKHIPLKRCNTCGKELFFEVDYCTKCRDDKTKFKYFSSVWFNLTLSFFLQKISVNRLKVVFICRPCDVPIWGQKNISKTI